MQNPRQRARAVRKSLTRAYSNGQGTPSRPKNVTNAPIPDSKRPSLGDNLRKRLSGS